MPLPEDNSSEAVPVSEISRIAVKPPPFWKNNPKLWFAQIEAQFEISGITREDTKFNHVVAAIESHILDSIQDLIISPPGSNQYSVLKTRLIEIYAETETSKLRTLLQGVELGDQRPSLLLKRMRDLAGKHFSDDLLKSLWLDRLPANIKLVLVASSEQLNNLATMADRILEFVPQTSVNSTTAPDPTPKHPSLEHQISELSKQVANLMEIVHNRQNFHRSRSPSFNRQMSRNGRSPFRRQYVEPSNEFCFYHTNFGASARKCKSPCKFRTVTRDVTKHSEN
nr:uncharacterized protein LOC122271294 [Parasteatoda tepidariorum]